MEESVLLDRRLLGCVCVCAKTWFGGCIAVEVELTSTGYLWWSDLESSFRNELYIGLIVEICFHSLRGPLRHL